jgi:hypothetical protein
LVDPEVAASLSCAQDKTAPNPHTLVKVLLSRMCAALLSLGTSLSTPFSMCSQVYVFSAKNQSSLKIYNKQFANNMMHLVRKSTHKAVNT